MFCHARGGEKTGGGIAPTPRQMGQAVLLVEAA